MRGYITGSAWKEYVEKGTVHGVLVSGPDGGKLVESEKFEKPLYTPCKPEESGNRHSSHIASSGTTSDYTVQQQRQKQATRMKIFTQIAVGTKCGDSTSRTY